MRNLLLAVDDTNLVQCIDGGTQATVHTEHLVIDESRETEIVEEICTIAPHVHRAELAQTFVIETIHLCDLTTFVVASNESDAVRVANLESEKQEEGFDTVEASIDKVAHEEVVRVRTLATDLEELLEIVELAMNISADGHRSVHTLHVPLLDQDLLGLVAERLHLLLLDDLTAPQLFNLPIQIRCHSFFYPSAVFFFFFFFFSF
mmetsp:Transcript_6233/g.18937  ORF Transcript_6233/g.18937 Transcript_6233/m.18937 type:complete len:205 (-) Transcript_6233:40-654(-)